VTLPPAGSRARTGMARGREPRARLSAGVGRG
jgi:hypothetical protein